MRGFGIATLLWLSLTVPGTAAGAPSTPAPGGVPDPQSTAADALLAALPDDRIIAFGDVHGGAVELVSLLTALGLVDGNEDWIGGRARVVSLGDLLDRGPDSRRVMDLLMKLESQAAAAGGSVQVVLGNHEIMNLTGDLRYVSPEEYAAFAADEDPAVRARERARYLARQAPGNGGDGGEHPDSPQPDTREDPDAAFDHLFPPGFFAHRAAFAASGTYGRWLLGKPQVLVLDGMAFVHGGLSEAFTELAIADYNRRAEAEVRELLALGGRLVAAGQLPPWQDLLTAPPPADPSPAADAEKATDAAAEADPALQALRDAFQFSDLAPTWYRGTAACHPLIEAPRFEAVLAARRLSRVIMGHTPTFPRIVQTRFRGRAILADTGMLASYYRGRPGAVVFGGAEPLFLSLDGGGNLQQRSGRPPVDVRAGDESAFLDEVARQLAGRAGESSQPPLEIRVAGRAHRAGWQREQEKDRHHRLAAQALDKFLGLGLVAPVVRVQRQVWEVLPANTYSERERIEGGLSRPDWCTGFSDYDLMYVLDTLMGNDARSADNVHYDRSTGLMYLTGHDAAFPSGRPRLPRYLAERRLRVPPLLAERLAALNEEALNELLGEHLKPRQIRALLARRDLLLRQPGSASP